LLEPACIKRREVTGLVKGLARVEGKYSINCKLPESRRELRTSVKGRMKTAIVVRSKPHSKMGEEYEHREQRL